MRHPLVPAVAVVLLLATYAAAGTALAGGPGPGDQVAVDGTVTGADGSVPGDALVLVGDRAMLTKLSPSELLSVAEDDPQNLAVVEVGEDGAFAATVPWKRADAAVAVSDAGVSEVVRLGHENTTVDLQLHERRPQTVYTAAASFAHDENRTRLHVSLVNNGDGAVEKLTVTVGSLPDGWSVAGVETDGSYDPAARTITWSSVAAGAEVDTTVTLAAPVDVDVGEYEVVFGAASDSHPVEIQDATVEKMPEDTAGPTKTVVGGDGGTPKYTDERTPSPRFTHTSTLTPTPASAPGLGLLAAVVGLATGVLLALRRRS
jgi:hypothetical protein